MYVLWFFIAKAEGAEYNKIRLKMAVFLSAIRFWGNTYVILIRIDFRRKSRHFLFNIKGHKLLQTSSRSQSML